jgi:hypothetical protein
VRDVELIAAEAPLEDQKGLAVWFDRNQNGVSDSGEVVPLDQTGIEALSVRATRETEIREASIARADGVVVRTEIPQRSIRMLRGF